MIRHQRNIEPVCFGAPSLLLPGFTRVGVGKLNAEAKWTLAHLLAHLSSSASCNLVTSRAICRHEYHQPASIGSAGDQHFVAPLIGANWALRIDSCIKPKP